jgi:hypothetical protein
MRCWMRWKKPWKKRPRHSRTPKICNEIATQPPYMGQAPIPRKYCFLRKLWISALKLWITPVRCGELAQLFGKRSFRTPPYLGGVFYSGPSMDFEKGGGKQGRGNPHLSTRRPGTALLVTTRYGKKFGAEAHIWVSRGFIHISTGPTNTTI